MTAFYLQHFMSPQITHRYKCHYIIFTKDEIEPHRLDNLPKHTAVFVHPVDETRLMSFQILCSIKTFRFSLKERKISNSLIRLVCLQI